MLLPFLQCLLTNRILKHSTNHSHFFLGKKRRRKKKLGKKAAKRLEKSTSDRDLHKSVPSEIFLFPVSTNLTGHLWVLLPC